MFEYVKTVTSLGALAQATLGRAIWSHHAMHMST